MKLKDKSVKIQMGTFTPTTAPLPIVDFSQSKPTNQVSDADFVKTWMTCRTNAEVAAKLGLTQSQTSSKATFLRKKGVKLPTKLNKVDPNSIDALNKLIAKYTGK